MAQEYKEAFFKAYKENPKYMEKHKKELLQSNIRIGKGLEKLERKWDIKKRK